MNAHAYYVGRLYSSLDLYDTIFWQPLSYHQSDFLTVITTHLILSENSYAMHLITYFYPFNYLYIVFVLVLKGIGKAISRSHYK